MYYYVSLWLYHAQVVPSADYKLKWTDPDEAGLVKFLVEEKG